MGWKTNNNIKSKKYTPSEETKQTWQTFLERNVDPKDWSAFTKTWEKMGSPYMRPGDQSHMDYRATFSPGKGEVSDTLNISETWPGDRYPFSSTKFAFDEATGGLIDVTNRNVVPAPKSVQIDEMMHEFGHSAGYNYPQFQQNPYPENLMDLVGYKPPSILNLFLDAVKGNQGKQTNIYDLIQPEYNASYIDSLNQELSAQYYGHSGKEDHSRYVTHGKGEHQAHSGAQPLVENLLSKYLGQPYSEYLRALEKEETGR